MVSKAPRSCGLLLEAAYNGTVLLPRQRWSAAEMERSELHATVSCLPPGLEDGRLKPGRLMQGMKSRCEPTFVRVAATRTTLAGSALLRRGPNSSCTWSPKSLRQEHWGQA